MTVDWKVVVVFDPENHGRDFAYTVGLHDLGHPELFLWARPTDGDDPGADWMLGDLDLAHRLNEVGQSLVDGTIEPGDSCEVAYDGGAATASMILRQPVAARTSGLEALQAAADAVLCEIRWSLRQRALGPRRELAPHEVDDARNRLATFIGPEGAATVDFPASARFGPHTPIVDLLRLQARALDDHRAERLLAATLLQYLPEGEIGALVQAARAAGLVDEIEQVIADATVDARAVAERAFADDADLARAVADLFGTIFSVAYGTEVVRHELPGRPPPCSEVLMALLDPDGARTRRYVDHVTKADPVVARVLGQPDLARLAVLVDGLDDETVGDLAGLWVHAAAEGHGSGLWLAALFIEPTTTIEVTWNAALALATAGNAALGVHVPDEVGPAVPALIDRISAGVRALAPLRRAG